MTLEELIPAWRKWGKQHGYWIRIRKSVLKKTTLPEETKHFLNQVGLPDMIAYSQIKRTLPRLTELVSETGPLPTSFARYRVLCEEGYHQFLCFDEEENGQMVLVMADPEYERIVMFANSSMLKFAECCVACENIDDEMIEQGIAKFSFQARNEFLASKYEQVIREVDPPALADDKTRSARRVRSIKEGMG